VSLPILACAIAFCTTAHAIPVRNIAGLNMITFYETTGSATAFPFNAQGPELIQKKADPLSGPPGGSDFQGLSDEFYDVYYSDSDGTFNSFGEYVTISGRFGSNAGGGGLNLAEMELNFLNGTNEFGGFVASFVQLGNNAIPGSANNAVDGNLATFTTMGNTVGQPNDARLRVTIGFRSALQCVRPPSGMVGWWPLDEVTTAIAHEIQAQRNGAQKGPTFTAGNFVTGEVAGAYRFDSPPHTNPSTFQYVEVPDYSQLDFGTGSFSIDAWVRLLSNTGGCHNIVTKESGPNGFQVTGYSLFLDDLNRLGFEMGTNNQDVNQSTTPLSLNDWHHVAVTVDRSTATPQSQLYLDGVPLGAPKNHTLIVGSITNTSVLRIGQKTIGTSAGFCDFGGDIDEVELFCRKLTAADILAIQLAGAGGKCKLSCNLPTTTGICSNFSSGTASLKLCNYTAASQTFNWTATGLPASGACNLNGPTSFSPPNESISVPAFTCIPPPPHDIVIGKPAGLAFNTKSCYRVDVNISGFLGVSCSGSVIPELRDICCVRVNGISPIVIPVGMNGTLVFNVTNSSASPFTLNYQLEEVPLPGDSGGAAMSLNGLPPGMNATGSQLIPAGGTVAITIPVAPLKPIRLVDIDNVRFSGKLASFPGDPFVELATVTVETESNDLSNSASVPALGTIGLFVLIGALAMAAWFTMGRRH